MEDDKFMEEMTTATLIDQNNMRHVQNKSCDFAIVLGKGNDTRMDVYRLPVWTYHWWKGMPRCNEHDIRAARAHYVGSCFETKCLECQTRPEVSRVRGHLPVMMSFMRSMRLT